MQSLTAKYIDVKTKVSVDSTPTMKCPGRQVAVPDEVAIFQMAGGGFIGRAVDQSELLGPVQGADFNRSGIFGLDEPPWVGKIEFNDLFRPGLQNQHIIIDRLE